jgi:aspartyl-tRNA(Asn)/glutamyl-tRNA(Gln) amidotransferase subunit B
LPELGLTIDTVKKSLPELPWQRRERYTALGINTQDVELYVKDPLFGGFFEEVEDILDVNAAEVKLASNYIANDLVKLVSDSRDDGIRGTENQDKMAISAKSFSKIIKMISAKKLSSKAAKELLAICMDGVSDPDAVAKEKGLLQQEMSPEQIQTVVSKVIADNSIVAADFRAGKTAALEYLVGQGMKALRGAADPVTLRELIRKQL